MKVINQLKNQIPEANLLTLTYEAEVEKSSEELHEVLNNTIQDLEAKYELTDIAEIPNIKNTREAYKQLGKSPSSYRNASEAMLRRIVKGQGLYQINNVVEINNLMSIQTGFSIGSYDLENLTGDITWKAAADGEKYQGIGKEEFNVEFLPTLYDDLGAFGNPSSDSKRAMINEGKHKIMTVVYSFLGQDSLNEIANQFESLLKKYCAVTEVVKNTL